MKQSKKTKSMQVQKIGRKNTPAHVKLKILQCPYKTRAIMMLYQGLALDFISKETKLTKGSIMYWAGLLGVKTTDYRKGLTPVAKKIVRETEVFAMDYLQKHLQNLKYTPTNKS